MQLLYNDLTNSQNIITFSNVPNILTFDNSDTSTGATSNAWYKFTVNSSGVTGYDSTKTYTISFGGYKITGTTDGGNVGGTVYLLPTTSDQQTQRYCTMTIANALKNIPWIMSNFDVWVETNLSDGSVSNTVNIRSRKPSVSMNVDYSCDWGNGFTFNETTPGMNGDNMLQGTAGKNFIVVDVYRYRDDIMIGATPTNTRFDYVTTLQKNYFGEPVNFNMTPVLSALVDEKDYDKMIMYKMSVYGFSDGKLVFSQPSNYMYFVNGYLCNFSSPYLKLSQVTWAANLKRGERYEGTFNNTTLYTYYPQIDFSLYHMNGNSAQRLVIYYLDSARNTIKTDSVQLEDHGGKSLKDYMVMLDQSTFDRSSYIDVQLGTITDRYRYNIIKPVKAADENTVERVYWFNEYGGISFMDFTGERSETRKEDIEYYERQTFDFYTNDEREMTKVYSKKIPVEVKHKTHYIDKNGTYLLYSLQNSKKAWIWHNAVKYYIHISSLDIAEASNASHIYQGQITYTYSLPDMF